MALVCSYPLCHMVDFLSPSKITCRLVRFNDGDIERTASCNGQRRPLSPSASSLQVSLTQMLGICKYLVFHMVLLRFYHTLTCINRPCKFCSAVYLRCMQRVEVFELGNRLVEPKGQVVGVLDWHHASILPSFPPTCIPDRLQNYDGPISQSMTPLSPPVAKAASPENFNELTNLSGSVLLVGLHRFAQTSSYIDEP